MKNLKKLSVYTCYPQKRVAQAEPKFITHSDVVSHWNRFNHDLYLQIINAKKQ